MLFDALLTVVFEDIVLNPTKIIQGTCLGHILLQKCFFGKVIYGPCGVFIIIFTSVQLA
jgi:hypothetical protein